MAGFTVSVSGAEVTARQLSDYATKAPGANERALMAAGLVIQAGAQRRSPVKTGRNRASINTKLVGSGLDAAVEVAPGTDYGPFLELGTVKMAARPYMRPAATEDAPMAEAAYNRVMSSELG